MNGDLCELCNLCQECLTLAGVRVKARLGIFDTDSTDPTEGMNQAGSELLIFMPTDRGPVDPAIGAYARIPCTSIIDPAPNVVRAERTTLTTRYPGSIAPMRRSIAPGPVERSQAIVAAPYGTFVGHLVPRPTCVTCAINGLKSQGRAFIERLHLNFPYARASMIVGTHDDAIGAHDVA